MALTTSFLRRLRRPRLTPAKLRLLDGRISQSLERLGDADLLYFAGLLASREHWRLLREFREAIAYLDIETTGLGGPGDHITTIALYDGRQVRHFVHGQNLDDFGSAIAEYRLLVTYNGKCFDVPFIERTLGVRLPHPHVDLRYVLKSLGYSGGLKAIEHRLGIDRDELEGVDGFLAVLLWHEYRRRGNQDALETLLDYIVQDVLNLDAVFACNWRMQHKKFPIPLPEWDGSPLNGRRLILFMEQGFGDLLQFCRFVPRLAAAGGKITLLALPELHRLLRTLPCLDAELEAAGDAVFLQPCPAAGQNSLQLLPSPPSSHSNGQWIWPG